MLAAEHGLSPRVRGNPAGAPVKRLFPGSIPACAGEPTVGVALGGIGGVYPRVCGGTGRPYMASGGRIGLSPRVRGNQWQCC